MEFFEKVSVVFGLWGAVLLFSYGVTTPLYSYDPVPVWRKTAGLTGIILLIAASIIFICL